MSLRVYPQTRLRRLRQTKAIRNLVAEYRLNVSDLIWPLFVIEGDDISEPIASMPDVSRYSIDRLVEQAQRAKTLGIEVIAIFPKIDAELKDDDGSMATDPNNLVCRAVRAVKKPAQNLRSSVMLLLIPLHRMAMMACL